MEIIYPLVGLFVGTLVGLTGVGGGSLMTPILILLGVKATTAVGSDLTYAAIMKVFGSAVHKKAGKVDMPLVWRLAAGSVPGSLAGAYLLQQLKKHHVKALQTDLTHIIGFMLLLVAVSLLIRSVKSLQDRIPTPKLADRYKQSLWFTVPVGFVIGFLVGVTSIGAGAFFAMIFVLVFGLEAKEIVGTDVVHGMILAAAAAIGHIWGGDVNWPLVGQLLLGAIPGVLIGSRLSTIAPAQVIRPALASVLLVTGLKTLTG